VPDDWLRALSSRNLDKILAEMVERARSVAASPTLCVPARASEVEKEPQGPGYGEQCFLVHIA
jgi:hypothetical protein